MKDHPRAPFERGSTWRRAVIVLPALVMLGNAGSVNAGSDDAPFDWTGTYAGVFAGAGRADNRIVDVDGFANRGNPGWAVDYDDAGFAGGALIGKKFELDGVPFRIELDGTFGDMSAKTDRVDPQGRDETAESKFRWIATARLGVEEAVGSATVFATAGLAAARIDNTLTDLDRSCVPAGDPDCRPTPWRTDPDDSFHDGSTEIGWVIGAGVETSLSDAWTLRLEGSYLDFGRSTHYANRSGDGRCGPGSPRRPCAYRVENRLGIVRLAIIRRFGL